MSLNVEANAGYHNQPRGIFLGTFVTDKQWDAIKSGTFDDMYVGDYWIINGQILRIAHFDYYINVGDDEGVGYCKKHHAVIVPDNCLFEGPMNSTDITTGAYMGSDFYTGANQNSLLSDSISFFENAFGADHLLTYRNMLPNAVSSGQASGSAWADRRVDLLSESLVCGTRVGGQSGHDVRADKSILALFSYFTGLIQSNKWYWLRNTVTAKTFCAVSEYGEMLNWDSADGHEHYSSANGGIRPYCVIC